MEPINTQHHCGMLDCAIRSLGHAGAMAPEQHAAERAATNLRILSRRLLELAEDAERQAAYLSPATHTAA